MRVPRLHIVPKRPESPKVAEDEVMSDTDPPAPFFLIVADYDRGLFSVEGPMTDDAQWQNAVRDARNHQRHVTCGPAGPDRDALAVNFRSAHNLAGAPPGSIVRPRP
jgi:hypothetical protein